MYFLYFELVEHRIVRRHHLEIRRTIGQVGHTQRERSATGLQAGAHLPAGSIGRVRAEGLERQGIFHSAVELKLTFSDKQHTGFCGLARSDWSLLVVRAEKRILVRVRILNPEPGKSQGIRTVKQLFSLNELRRGKMPAANLRTGGHNKNGCHK